MSFKYYTQYQDFKKDLAELLDTYDLTNQDDIKWFNLDLEYWIQDYTDYLQGYEKINVHYTKPLLDLTNGAYIKKQEVEISDLSGLLNQHSISPKDIANTYQKIGFHYNLKDFQLYFNSRKTAEVLFDFLKYDNEDNWNVAENFLKHIHLGEIIIHELKEVHIGKISIEKSVIEVKPKNSLINNPTKIPIKGSLQLIGYYVSELIEKGFIEAPRRNGNFNRLAISRMILEHFEFVDKKEQPKSEGIRKALFDDNRLSVSKQARFTIPKFENINDD